MTLMRCSLLFQKHISMQYSLRRQIYSETGLWPPTCTYDFDHSCLISHLKLIEKHWKPLVSQKWHELSKNITKPNTRYILSMFPYPSGSLHLGHVRIYTMGDIISRFNQLNGYNIINPMGWDSFGLPAENAAIERSLNPKEWTNMNISNMRNQFDCIALNFDWREATSDPAFYKWTQWLFVQLFKSNLAYKSLAKVNWDPIDCTVLANEQVDEEGRSWRSGAKIEKRYLRQWFIKTRMFLEDLHNGADVNCSKSGVHWQAILARQRDWIGDLKTFIFYLNDSSGNVLPILCDTPELFLTGNSFVAVPSDHWLKQGDCVRNPFNGQTLNVKVIVNNENNVSEAILMNDDSFCENAELRDKVMSMCKRNSELGGFKTSYHFSDWVVSRQRYWGTPIPIIHCPQCGSQPVPESSLPVILPEVNSLDNNKNSSQSVVNRLKAVASNAWLKEKCPKCNSSNCERETDTLDTMFDSSWYYLRFASEPLSETPFVKSDTKSPVWLYLGGEEHVCGHLLFARFVYHFLRKMGYLESESGEPFNSIFLQAVVTGKTYIVNGKYLPNEEAKRLLSENKLTTEDIEIKYEKMSKSKGNGVDPLCLVDKYGIDATRLSVVGYQRAEKKKVWKGEEEEYTLTLAFIKNMILTIDQFIFLRLCRDETAMAPVVRRFSVHKNLTEEKAKQKILMLRERRNQFVDEVTSYYDSIIDSGTVSNKLHSFLNKVVRPVALSEKVALSIEYERCLADLIIALSPIAPHLSEECWQGFVKYADRRLNDFYELKKLVCEQKWLQLDADYERRGTRNISRLNDTTNDKKKKIKKKKKEKVVVHSQ